MAGLLALIAAAFGVIATVLWRLNSVADSARGLAETAGDLANLNRRWSWSRKANADKLRLVDDPRFAAAAMMVSVAQADGALTATERAAILAECVGKFGCNEKTAEEMLGYGRFLVGTSHDPDDIFRKLAPLFIKSLDKPERRDLMTMLSAVAAADGPVSQSLEATLARIERGLK